MAVYADHKWHIRQQSAKLAHDAQRSKAKQRSIVTRRFQTGAVLLVIAKRSEQQTRHTSSYRNC